MLFNVPSLYATFTTSYLMAFDVIALHFMNGKLDAQLLLDIIQFELYLIEAILTDMNLKTIGTILKNNRNTKD
jgi:hypothetical protein